MAGSAEELKKRQEKLEAYKLHKEELLSLSPLVSVEQRQVAVKFFQSGERKKDAKFMLDKHPEWKSNGTATQFNFSDIDTVDNLPGDIRGRLDIFLDCFELCTLELDEKVNEGLSSEQTKRKEFLEYQIEYQQLIIRRNEMLRNQQRKWSGPHEGQAKVNVAVMLAREYAMARTIIRDVRLQAQLIGKLPLETVNSVDELISAKQKFSQFPSSVKEFLEKTFFHQGQPVRVDDIIVALEEKQIEEWQKVDQLITNGALGRKLAAEWKENEAKIKELKAILYPSLASSRPAPAVDSQEMVQMRIELEKLDRFRGQIDEHKRNDIDFDEINGYDQNVQIMLQLLRPLRPHWVRNGIAIKFNLSSLSDNSPEDATQRLALFMDCLDLCRLELDIKLSGPSSDKSKKIRILENLIDLRAMIFPPLELRAQGSGVKLKAEELQQGRDNIHRKLNALKCNLDSAQQAKAVSALDSVRHEHEKTIKQLMQQPWIKHLKLEEQGLDKQDLFNSMNLPSPLDKDNALAALENLRLCTIVYWLSACQREMLDKIQEKCGSKDAALQQAFKDIKNSSLSKKVNSEAWEEVHKFIAKSELAKDWKACGEEKKKCRDELLKRLKSQQQLHPGSALGLKIGKGKQTDIINVLTNLPVELPDIEAKYMATDTNDSAKGGTLISKEPGVYKAEFKPNGIVSITGPQARTQGLDAVLTVFKKAGVKAVDIEVIKKSDGTIDDTATCAILNKAIAQDMAPVIMNKTAYQTLEYIQSKSGDAAVAEKYVTAVVNFGDKAAQDQLINGIPGLDKGQKDKLLAKAAKKEYSVVSDILATRTPSASVNPPAVPQSPVNITPHNTDRRRSSSVQRNSNVPPQTRQRKDEASVPSFTRSGSRSTSSAFFDPADSKGKMEEQQKSPSVVLSTENSDPNSFTSSSSFTAG